MKAVVFDATAGAEIVQGTDYGQAMEALVSPGETIIAPDFYRIEIRSVFWKYACFDAMPEAKAFTFISEAMKLIDRFYDMGDLADEALLEALRQRHPIYDMLYLCLGRRYNATVFTLDRKLQDACIEAGVNCICAVDF